MSHMKVSVFLVCVVKLMLCPTIKYWLAMPLPPWLNARSIGADVAGTLSIFLAIVFKMGYLFAFILQNFKGFSSFVKSVSSKYVLNSFSTIEPSKNYPLCLRYQPNNFLSWGLY